MTAFAQGPSRLVYRRNRLKLASLAPSSGVAAATVTIQANGENFNGACVLYYDGAAKATTFVSKTTISASVLVGAAGAHSVEVRDSATGRQSSALPFTVT
jgi:hypothetical protein